jgi:integrase
MTNRIHHYWDPAFKNKNLKDITRADLKQFSLSLTGNLTRPENYKGRFPEKLAPAAINKILLAGTIALNWAFHDGQIPINPAERLQHFSGKSQKRGVLTPAEAAEVFAVIWTDKRAYTGNMVAMTCGMRSGEVLALQKADLSADGLTLNVTHSWSRADGLKCPKNGDERKAPILPGMKSALLNLAGESPWDDSGTFLFYSTAKPDIPMDQKFLIDGLRGAIETVNEARKKKDPAAALIDWKGRNITFHSWRHFYAARMADKMSAEAVARVTGHKSRAVFEAYADHIEAENLDLMRDAAAETFGTIINFAEKKGA